MNGTGLIRVDMTAGRRVKPGPSSWCSVSLLLIVALLVQVAEVPAQQRNPRKRLELQSNQAEPAKWYSKIVPWNKKPPQPSFQQRPDWDGKVNNPTKEERAEGHLSLARLSERRGQPEQAKTIYLGLIRKYAEKFPLAYHRLGVLAVREGNFVEARRMFGTALHFDGSNVDLLSDIGYSLYLQNELEEAEIFYRRALDLDGDHEATCNNLAILLAEQGNHRESLALFRHVNDEAKAYSNQAYMLSQIGELEKAKEFYSHALKLDGTLRSTANAMIQLVTHQEHLKSTPVGPDTPALSEIADGRPVAQKPAISDKTPLAIEQQAQSQQGRSGAVAGQAHLAIQASLQSELASQPLAKPEQHRPAVAVQQRPYLPQSPRATMIRPQTTSAKLTGETMPHRPPQSPRAENLSSRRTERPSGPSQRVVEQLPKSIEFVRQQLRKSLQKASPEKLTTPALPQANGSQKLAAYHTPAHPMVVRKAQTRPTSAPSPEQTTFRISDLEQPQTPRPLRHAGAVPQRLKNINRSPQLYGAQSPVLAVERPTSPDAWSEIRQASTAITGKQDRDRMSSWAQSSPKPEEMSWWLPTDDKAIRLQKSHHPNGRASWVGSQQPPFPLSAPRVATPLNAKKLTSPRHQNNHRRLN